MSESIAGEVGVEETDVAEMEETVDEPESIPEPGTEEADEAEAQDAEDGEDSEEVEEEPEYEEIEFDFGGKKFAVSKDQTVDAVAGELQEYAKSVEGDYTRKTQALAEQRKSMEAQAEAIQQLTQLNGESFELYTKANALQEEISRYEAVPQHEIDALWNEDPDEARRLDGLMIRRRNELQGIQSQFQQKSEALRNEQSRQRGRFMEEGRKQVSSKIKNFNEGEFVDYIVNTYGIPEEKAKEWSLNPAGTEMGWKAMMFDKMNTKAKTVKAPKIKPAVSVPASKPQGKTRSKTYAEMTMEEYAAARNKEEGYS